MILNLGLWFNFLSVLHRFETCFVQCKNFDDTLIDLYVEVGNLERFLLSFLDLSLRNSYYS